MQVIVPGERHMDEKLEPERRGIWRTIVIAHIKLGIVGFFIYGPVMIIGLHALELVPKNAAGTAAGFTGFFGYVFGAAIAGTGVGWIADRWGWGGVFGTMAACCLLTILFSALTLTQGRPNES